ncbi:DNA-binding transcriptional LysR family regulator [Propionicimonas paludicola]|uniref:DNA-binding transcriptional LysR family regulator n=1 Tax=Propionicimonas paludicola TaxID=185243 RepID=A0A2A9CSF4_9ACTN|nr:LysR family transcriptional regulator [Propionicimonas paludicola]PFG17308.1 DNA-binding transcriptional LysR family regulator [Propionicimonas paludicola]
MSWTSRLDVHTVRIVRAVAEAGSITAAAAALGYSQPALSQHLQRAEHRLGLPLLLRTGRTVRLTEAGRVLVRHAGPILAALQAAEDELGQLADRSTGTVRLAGFPSASSTIVPLLIARIAQRHPGLRLIYTEAEPPEALALLADGAVDVALTFAYPGDPADPHAELSGIEVVPLFDDPSVVVLPSRHRLSGSGSVGLAALAQDDWIGGCPLCRGHLLAACAALGFSPKIAHATDNSVAVLGLVAAGVGVALQPELALEPLELPSGTSAHRLDQASDRQVRAVHLSGAQAVPAVATTLSALGELTAARRTV